MSKIVTLVQARTSSTRLPGKILLPLSGEPLLIRMIERVQTSKLAGQIVVVTTEDDSDNPIVDLCNENQTEVFRGDMNNLLDRHYQAAKALNADIVLKIPSDCPLIDPEIIDFVISHYLENEGNFDYVSNLHPATYPDGNDVEVMSIAALEMAWKNATRKLEFEHTTPYLWENPDRFKIGNVTWPTGKDYSMSHRWTIDYKEDYEFIKAVYDTLYPKNKSFSLEDILNLTENERPEIQQFNSHLAGVNWYRNHLDELKTISSDKTKIIN
jgi:spore coat polysaccharide biosynthesis protein SpsF